MKRQFTVRPQHGRPLDLKAFAADVMRRFPKIMKRLHEAELEEEKKV